jgi:pimeloyl-ACP methyl ester carboxylesterase
VAPQDVIAVANAAGLERFVYVGHSMGGGVGLHLAQSAHAARLVQLVLVAPIPCRGVYDPTKAHDAEIARRATFSFSDWSAYRRSVHARTDYMDMDPAEWATAIMMDRSVSRAYYDGSWQSMCDFSVDPAKVTVPTLMVAGACDNLLGNNLHDFKALPVATLHVFSRVAHGIPRETPVGLAEAIADFVRHGVLTWQTILGNVVLPAPGAASKL